MPFIDVKLTKKLSQNDTEQLKSELGKAITAFPGKSEGWLMCNIADNQKMYFQGKDGDTAFVEVKLFGSVQANAAEKCTREICKILSDLGIPSSRTYVRYEGGTDWGYNGSNF